MEKKMITQIWVKKMLEWKKIGEYQTHLSNKNFEKKFGYKIG